MHLFNKEKYMNFEDLDLIPPLLQALKDEEYSIPTPIQEQAIPVILQGKDVLGSAQTGTGKTAAFAVPILQMLKKEVSPTGNHNIQALILAPTRELCIQIKDSFVSYGRHLHLRVSAIYGGVSQRPQEAALKVGIDILVATPGRLLDLMNQRLVKLSAVKIFVLDEADQMLDMGFIHDVKRIITALPVQRQTLLFSATMPTEISRLSSAILKDPVRIAVSPITSTVDGTEQYVYHVDKKNKKNLLIHLLKSGKSEQALVFSRTKHGANKLSEELAKVGISSEAIHGNKSQAARQLALNNFKIRKTRVLVATDIAARGIDVAELPLVINFDLPNVPETYIHRIGRTGRAGLAGKAVSFCDEEERDDLKGIEKLLSRKIPVVDEHPFPTSVLLPDDSVTKKLHSATTRSFGYAKKRGGSTKKNFHRS
jgi:ATP-dependent RNA helicase RhlE